MQSFIKIKLARIETLIILCLRQIIAEDFSEKTQNYSRLLLNLLQEENEWIVTNIKDIALIFAKLLRIFAFSLSAETSEYKAATHKLIFIIWQKRKNGNENDRFLKYFIRLYYPWQRAYSLNDGLF